MSNSRTSMDNMSIVRNVSASWSLLFDDLNIYVTDEYFALEHCGRLASSHIFVVQSSLTLMTLTGWPDPEDDPCHWLCTGAGAWTTGAGPFDRTILMISCGAPE